MVSSHMGKEGAHTLPSFFLEKKLKKPLTSFDIYYIIIIEERKYKQENKGEMKNES